MSRELLSNIVHYVRSELNIGSAPKEKEPAPVNEEPEEDPTSIEADGETTYTATGTSLMSHAPS
jgi:hypothetical protein